MNPIIMQMWIEAFSKCLRGEYNDGETEGYKAAKYAEDVVKGAQKAAAERQAGKVVTL